MTSEFILHFMKKLCLFNVPISRNFYENRFLTESRSFLGDIDELTLLKTIRKCTFKFVAVFSFPFRLKKD